MAKSRLTPVYHKIKDSSEEEEKGHSGNFWDTGKVLVLRLPGRYFEVGFIIFPYFVQIYFIFSM